MIPHGWLFHSKLLAMIPKHVWRMAVETYGILNVNILKLNRHILTWWARGVQFMFQKTITQELFGENGCLGRASNYRIQHLGFEIPLWMQWWQEKPEGLRAILIKRRFHLFFHSSTHPFWNKTTPFSNCKTKLNPHFCWNMCFFSLLKFWCSFQKQTVWAPIRQHICIAKGRQTPFTLTNMGVLGTKHGASLENLKFQW